MGASGEVCTLARLQTFSGQMNIIESLFGCPASSRASAGRAEEPQASSRLKVRKWDELNLTEFTNRANCRPSTRPFRVDFQPQFSFLYPRFTISLLLFPYTSPPSGDPVRNYNELLTAERNKLFRIFIFIMCPLQMFDLILHFSKRWPNMDMGGHLGVIEYLVFYPLIALYALKKQPDPFLIAMFAYVLLGLGVTFMMHS
jgi:hypothetical protein